ncbi:uncharacterized protein LOC132203249 isoform X1 [Neocloeon triangulifer]|uniref:uncharacterized protein LOC132203249 isoform X1 n=1 Tax=Neocloeon triangulifer TaxID=2078957 RepID=UPI00286F267D|nr:uncharacterized protein LOC132203249 isoform X1 [Neocloeon triangulifer]
MAKELHTEDSNDYEFNEVSTTSSKCVLRFKVKAAHDAHVCLSSTEEQDATPFLEVFIGGWDNSKCAIRRDRAKPDRAEAETPDVLSADEFRGFWISWDSEGKIEVGREGEEEAFLSYVEPEPFEITHYGVRTAWGANGDWEIEKDKFTTLDGAPYLLATAPRIVKGGSLLFSVRAPHDAHVTLTSGPADGGNQYEVFVGGWKNSKCALRKNKTKPDLVVVETPNILDSGRFRNFKLTWNKGLITLQDENGAVIFEHQDVETIPITHFGVRTSWGARGDWKLGAHSKDLEPAETPGEACWVAATNGEVPEGAVCGGTDLECDLMIARAVHEGELLPGKFVPAHGVTYVSWNGAEHAKEEYEMLCGCKPVWFQINQGDTIPENALPGGRTAEGETLFIGRVPHEGTVTVGKVHPSHGTCYIPYAGQELGFPDFEVLVRQ